jgi:maleate isomerase
MPVDRSGPKIGVLVPFTNVNLEPDMMALCPPGCTMHFERIGGYDVDEIPGSAQLAGLGASGISGVWPAVVLYGCTSATLTHGTLFDHDLAAKIAARSNAKSLTAAG